jgi:spore germination cell wall hydrolase CwlJ-like protein
VATGDLDLATLMAKPGPKSSPELDCLARTIYFEARGEPLRGQAAVAEVVLNRVEAAGFPDTVCGVVRQGAEGGQAGCQFSYACDGQADRISDAVAFDLARRIAAAVIGGAPRTLTDGATYFHSRAVRPAWSRRFERTAVIGAQYFYREPLRTAQN